MWHKVKNGALNETRTYSCRFACRILIYIYIYIYICVCIYTHIYMCVYTHTHSHTHTYIYIYIYMCVSVRAYVCSCVSGVVLTLRIQSMDQINLFKIISFIGILELIFYQIIIIIIIIIIIYCLGDFYISLSWWFFAGIWVTSSLPKSSGLFSVIRPFSIM